MQSEPKKLSVKVETERRFILTLDEHQATLLRNVFQNPLFSETPEEEDADIRRLRREIFCALSSAIRDSQTQDYLQVHDEMMVFV